MLFSSLLVHGAHIRNALNGFIYLLYESATETRFTLAPKHNASKRAPVHEVYVVLRLSKYLVTSHTSSISVVPLFIPREQNATAQSQPVCDGKFEIGTSLSPAYTFATYSEGLYLSQERRNFYHMV